MANTYTQIHIQAVFAVKYRIGIIQKNWKDELFKYITGIIRENDHRLLAINGMPDHVHVFFGMRPAQSLSDLLQVIKANSSKWINERGFVKGRFELNTGICWKNSMWNMIRDIFSKNWNNTNMDP
ncbi:MAG TPA: IS200/IS605 family transposase [Cyclobacteriaceae bacterium]|nr:IS200/IS605 family transposase [Cyclobacteriaceae bacterium]